MNLRTPWNRHYQTEKSRQLYPDENLVRLLAAARSELNPENASALDYGFGSGRHLHLLQEMRFGRIAGCEISDVACEQGRQSFPEMDLRLVTEADITGADINEADSKLPFDDESFDVIVCWGVLHYLSDSGRIRLLEEFARLLTSPGLFVGTLRSNRDTHFAHSDVSDASMTLFSEDDARTLLDRFFKDVELGHMERTPIGKLDQRIAHWFFRARRS